MKNIVEAVIISGHCVVGQTIADVNAARALKHIGLAADVALEDVDKEIAWQPFLGIGVGIERLRIKALLGPSIEDFGEVLDGGGL